VFVCFVVFDVFTYCVAVVDVCWLMFIVDDDECKEHPDSNCTNPTCMNTKGSYACGCDVGYDHNLTDPNGGFYCLGKIRCYHTARVCSDEVCTGRCARLLGL